MASRHSSITGRSSPATSSFIAITKQLHETPALPAPLQTFHVFPRLPKELRLIIWEIEFNRPHIIQIVRTPKLNLSITKRASGLLGACSESREVTQKSNAKLVDISSSHGPARYVDLENDILWITGPAWKKLETLVPYNMQGWKQKLNLWMGPGFRDLETWLKIKHLALDSALHNGEHEPFWVAELTQMKLEELFVVVQKEIVERNEDVVFVPPRASPAALLLDCIQLHITEDTTWKFMGERLERHFEGRREIMDGGGEERRSEVQRLTYMEAVSAKVHRSTQHLD